MRKRIMLIASVMLVFAFAFAGTNSNNQRGVADQAYTITGSYPTRGDYIFVDNSNSNAIDSYPRNGGSWDKPLRTINYALARCTNKNGDVIFVSPNHAETLSSVSAIAFNKDGVRVVGLGSGRNRPTLTWSGREATLGVSAYNVSLENFVLQMARASGTTNYVRSGISIYGKATDFKLLNNEIIVAVAYTATSGTTLVQWAIDMSGGTRTQISGNRFIGPSPISTGSAVSAFVYVRGNKINEVTFSDNYLDGMTSNTPYAMLQIDTAVSGWNIRNNVWQQQNSSASPWNVAEGSIGQSIDNYYFFRTPAGGSGTTKISIDDIYKSRGNGW